MRSAQHTISGLHQILLRTGTSTTAGELVFSFIPTIIGAHAERRQWPSVPPDAHERATGIGLSSNTADGHVPIRSMVFQSLREEGTIMSGLHTTQQPQPAEPMPSAQPKTKKPLYRRLWFWLVIVVAALAVIGVSGGNGSSTNGGQTTSSAQSQRSTDAKQGRQDAQSEQQKKEESVPAEYKSALRQADVYANTMHMSKAGLLKQLTSEYGGQFSQEAAQYAVDNVKADWNANALAAAKNYQETMAMSPEAIRDQLTSEYGDQFTAEEADYAIQHLND